MRHLILGSLILTATAATQARADVVADLSQYSCAGLDTAAAADTRRSTQIIDGKQTDWTAFFTADGTRRLKCITTTIPDARALSRDEAKAFIAKVAGTGAKPATALRVPLAASTTTTVRPEPLRMKPTSLGTVSKVAPLPAAQDITATAAPAARALSAQVQSAPLAAATVSSSLRTRTADTTIRPWRGVGQLDVTFPNGETVRCTGSLISEYAVLTAGACVHNAARGGYAKAAVFHAGQYDAVAGDGTPVRPFGSKSDVESLRTTQHWTEISGNTNLTATDHAYNIGAVLFKTPYRPALPQGDVLGGVSIGGTFGPDEFFTAGPMEFVGYPSSVDGKVAYGQYLGSGPATEDSRVKYAGIAHIAENTMATTAGDVGAPMIGGVDTMFHSVSALGLVTYANADGTVAGGPTFEYGWNRDLLLGWQAWRPAGPPLPTEAASDLKVASIFSTNQSTSQSYLRFHNAGATTGKVTVELKNPTTGATVATWTSGDIARDSELQVFIADIERMATGTGAKPFNYAMSVKPTFEGYFQHVLWQVADNTLTNLTSCDTGATNDPKTLVAVHSSLLKMSYPSLVVVYNSGNTASDISLGISDARDGTRLGTYHVGVVQAGGQAVVNVSDMEKAASPKITPSSGMYHYVISADTTFNGYLQHIVQNTGNGVLTDMSIVCKLSPGS